LSIKLMAVGDIFLQTKDRVNNPLCFVQEVLKNADIVFGNLEAPVTKIQNQSIEKAVSLKALPENLSFLKKANCSIVNLANNHICDYGATGAIETIEYLSNEGIQFIGVGQNIYDCLKEVVFKINNITATFIGFYIDGESLSSDGIYVAGMNRQLVLYRIAELKSQYDFVIVSFHWGIENVFYPSPEQQVFARECIDTGASVILGHHPHRLQGIEEYDKGVIFYSLGNFNFEMCGAGISPHPELSAIADITLHDDGSVTHTLMPIKVDNEYRPKPIAEPEQLLKFHMHISNISALLSSDIEKWWWFGEIAKPYLVGNGEAFLIRIRRYGIKHLYQMVSWLSSRFVIKCYVGIILRWLRRGHSQL